VDKQPRLCQKPSGILRRNVEPGTPADGRIEVLRKGITPDDLRIFKGRIEVSGKLNQMISSSSKTVEIWTTMRGIQSLADFHLEQLKRAKARGTKICIIAPITS
jgi:hypothetical protein